jgi:Arc/MetJ-type ribon-helix-helix transcriptional regulator
MTVTLSPEHAEVVDQAIRAGIIEQADEVVSVGIEALRVRLEERTASGQTLSAEEWMRKFRAWAHSHPADTPLLSDDTISRESIYAERGL